MTYILIVHFRYKHLIRNHIRKEYNLHWYKLRYGLYSANIVFIVLISLSFNQSLVTKSEAFQAVHHVTFILCYTILYDFRALVFALIRVRKHWRDDITQGKQ